MRNKYNFTQQAIEDIEEVAWVSQCMYNSTSVEDRMMDQIHYEIGFSGLTSSVYSYAMSAY